MDYFGYEDDEECVRRPHATLHISRYMKDWDLVFNPDGGTRIDIIDDVYDVDGANSLEEAIESIGGFNYHRGGGGEISYTHSGRQYANALDGPYKDNTPEDTERRLIRKGVAKRYIEVLVQSSNTFRTVPRRKKRLQEASNNRRLTKQTQERVVIVISSSDSDSDSNNSSNINDNQNSSASKSNSSSVGVQRKTPTNYLLPVPLAKRVVSNKRNRDEEICGFGKHKNARTLLWIYKNDKRYCSWALGKKNTSGKLKEFVGYVKCKNRSANKNVTGNKRPRQNLHETATPQRKVRQRRSGGISNTRR